MMITFLPNGQGGIVPLFIPSSGSQDPEKYEAHYLTSDNVPINVTFETSNKDVADQLAIDLTNKMGWTTRKVEPTKVGFFTAVLMGITIALVVSLLLMTGFLFFIMIMDMAGYLTFRESREWMEIGTRIGIWSFIPVAILAAMGCKSD